MVISLSNGLTHVIDSQRSDGNRGQGFHFHSGLSVDFDPCLNVNATPFFVRRTLNSNRGYEQWVTQRDEFRCFLGRHDPGDPRDRERIALGHLTGGNESQRIRAHRDAAGRDGPPAQLPISLPHQPSGRDPGSPYDSIFSCCYLHESEHPVCSEQFGLNRNLMWTRAFARGTTVDTLGGVPGEWQPGIFFHTYPLLSVVFIIHGVAQDIIDRNIGRTGRQALTTARRTIVVRNQTVVFFEQPKVGLLKRLPGGVQVFVDVVEGADRDHQPAHVRIGQHPLKGRLGERFPFGWGKIRQGAMARPP